MQYNIVHRYEKVNVVEDRKTNYHQNLQTVKLLCSDYTNT